MMLKPPSRVVRFDPMPEWEVAPAEGTEWVPPQDPAKKIVVTRTRRPYGPAWSGKGEIETTIKLTQDGQVIELSGRSLRDLNEAILAALAWEPELPGEPVGEPLYGARAHDV